MALLGLLSIPGTLVLLGLLLFLSDMAENRVVSPQALIVKAAKGRSTSPERAERLVAAEVERLLQRKY